MPKRSPATRGDLNVSPNHPNKSQKVETPTFENENYQYFEEGHRIVVRDGVKEVHRKTVSEPHKKLMKHLVIGKDVKIIEPLAFEECDKLEELILGESVTEIQFDAFRECSALQRIQFNAALQEVGDSAFSSCKIQEVLLGAEHSRSCLL